MRRKAEMHIAELNIKYQMATAELTSLREELQRTALLTSAGANSSRYTDQVAAVSSGLENENSLEYAGIYELTKCIPLSNGNCRVIAPYGSLNVLCVSQPTTNPIFKGFGIRKVCLCLSIYIYCFNLGICISTPLYMAGFFGRLFVSPPF
ncbi:unnamed protein product [Protopolystoma xenopodis]|uniref:Uncharacterized protein n=1 Tax=Protopolystoma xenopodis TaxID=117903 RepID=A0A448XA13_9PLAT|nr:unnamed protein product [Protopolystoma xenopodis]